MIFFINLWDEIRLVISLLQERSPQPSNTIVGRLTAQRTAQSQSRVAEERTPSPAALKPQYVSVREREPAKRGR